ncbi:MAG TPA: hypothetical protein VGM06_01820 [Polyangiaceae bacterium]|jgi:hypothetical protein
MIARHEMFFFTFNKCLEGLCGNARDHRETGQQPGRDTSGIARARVLLEELNGLLDKIEKTGDESSRSTARAATSADRLAAVAGK